MRRWRVAAALALLPAAPVAAAPDFGGWHIGPTAGAVQTHFVIETDAGQRLAQPTAWGVGYGVVAGHDWMLGRLLLGVGAELVLGGRTATANLIGPPVQGSASLSPRWGYTLTARVGVAATDRLLIYARGGYVGHRQRVVVRGDLGSSLGDWNRSFTIGAGAEYALGRRVALRAEFHHLDGTRNQLMLALPVRF
jgi:opacity protein-like surface antigen